MSPGKWTAAWRIAVLAVLGWIGVELHLFRHESNNGLDYRAERTLDDIERNTRETREAVDSLRRYR